MPKIKTHSGAKKRFKITANGKVKAGPSNKRHRLISRPQEMKRDARGNIVLFKTDGENIKKHFLRNGSAK